MIERAFLIGNSCALFIQDDFLPAGASVKAVSDFLCWFGNGAPVAAVGLNLLLRAPNG
jgi:hypothetical protein